MKRIIIHNHAPLPAEIVQLRFFSFTHLGLLTGVPISFFGIVLHQEARLVGLKLLDGLGNRIPCAVKLGLKTPRMHDFYPQIAHSEASKVYVSGISPDVFEQSEALIQVVASFDNGETASLASITTAAVEEIITSDDRVPTKRNSLRFLRQNGLSVGTVIDVGVQHKTEDLIQVFPDVKHILFEPVRENYPYIRKNYERIDFELVEAAAFSEEGEGLLEIRTRPGSPFMMSGVVNKAADNTRTIDRVTLDGYLKNKNYDRPYVLKIDVDGNEIPVLQGATQTLHDCSCVIIEVPLADALFERARFLKDRAFVLWDLVDLGYYRDNLSHFDLIYLSRKERMKPPFNPRVHLPFDRTMKKSFLH